MKTMTKQMQLDIIKLAVYNEDTVITIAFKYYPRIRQEFIDFINILKDLLIPLEINYFDSYIKFKQNDSIIDFKVFYDRNQTRGQMRQYLFYDAEINFDITAELKRRTEFTVTEF